MDDLRREDPEPPVGPPQLLQQPGMADGVLQELAPFLSEDGIDVNNLRVDSIEALQDALDRAIERRNMQLFTPVGQAREIAADTLRRALDAIAEGDTERVGAILATVVPESSDNSAPTAAGCIGIAVGLLDEWLSGRSPEAPAGLAEASKLPAGHWNGERAATDLLALARKGRAFRSLDEVSKKQGSPQVLTGAVLAMFAVLDTWARVDGVSLSALASRAVR